MKNKNTEDFFAIAEAAAMIFDHTTFRSMFGGLSEPKETYPYERLGDEYELRPIEMKDSTGKAIVNRENYSHLYHKGLKISNEVFRKGGMGGIFKDGYCELIHYTPETNPEKSSKGFSFGTFIIINHLGDIVLKGGKFSSDHPHHIGGHLASIKDYIYDLRTGKAISPKSSSAVVGKNSIIIEHRYEWYNKEVTLPLGIYQIDFKTAEIIKIDDTK